MKIFILIFIISLQFILINAQGPSEPLVLPKAPEIGKEPIKAPKVKVIPPPEKAATPSEPSSNALNTSIAGGLVSGLILITIMALGFFLLKLYKKRKENSNAITTPGRSIILEEKDESISGNNELSTLSYMNKSLPVPKETVNSNQGQETISDHKNQSENSEVIQKLRQGLMKEMGHNLTNDGQSNLFGSVDKEIIEYIKREAIQDMIQDLKQEFKQNLKKEVISSFVSEGQGIGNWN